MAISLHTPMAGSSARSVCGRLSRMPASVMPCSIARGVRLQVRAQANPPINPSGAGPVRPTPGINPGPLEASPAAANLPIKPITPQPIATGTGAPVNKVVGTGGSGGSSGSGGGGSGGRGGSSSGPSGGSSSDGGGFPWTWVIVAGTALALYPPVSKYLKQRNEETAAKDAASKAKSSVKTAAKEAKSTAAAAKEEAPSIIAKAERVADKVEEKVVKATTATSDKVIAAAEETKKEGKNLLDGIKRVGTSVGRKLRIIKDDTKDGAKKAAGKAKQATDDAKRDLKPYYTAAGVTLGTGLLVAALVAWDKNSGDVQGKVRKLTHCARDAAHKASDNIKSGLHDKAVPAKGAGVASTGAPASKTDTKGAFATPSSVDPPTKLNTPQPDPTKPAK